MKEYVEMGLLLDAISVSKLDYLKVADVICKVPTADVAEVVRCKDCIWRNDDSSPMWLPCMEMETKDNYYCADGVRKTNGKVH